MYFTKEWIEDRIAATPDEHNKVRELIYFVSCASDYLVKDCYALALQAKKMAEALDYPEGVLASEFYLHFALFHEGRIGEAVAGLERIEKDVLANPEGEMSGMIIQMYAFLHWSAGKRDKAFEYIYLLLKHGWEVQPLGFAWVNFALGVFHFDLKDYDASLTYFEKSRSLALYQKDIYGLARTQAGIGGIHIARGEFADARKEISEALEGFRVCNHQTAMSRCLNDLGVINKKLGHHAEAERLLNEALVLRRNVDYLPGMITTQIELAELLVTQEKTDEAEALLVSALDLSKKLRSQLKAAQSHRQLADLYKKKGDPWKAIEHLEHFFEVKSSFDGEEASNRLNRLQQKFATEKSEQEAEIHRLKNVELKTAYDEIEEKNKNILDSIFYARRIQSALLASDHLLSRNLVEYFVIYRPKDIVSGDFYWAVEKGDKFFLAAADSTGHGVPGAFMSLLNSSYLDEAVNEKNLDEPAAILNEVRRQLVAALNPEGSIEETRDGMDAVLISLDKRNSLLHFACSNNPLVLVRNNKLEVFAPDKFPVGIHPGYENKPFSAHSLELKKGDMVYLLTDGYADQFGGPIGKKFKFRQLKELLLAVHHEPVAKQKELLEAKHAEWRGDLEQVDDMLIIGFKITGS
jgi:serine phosphatase RsbU (regulator of sigma subunit)